MLDEVYQRLLDAKCDTAEHEMRHLVRGLRDYQRRVAPQEWKHWVERRCLTHPLRELIHQDPITARAFNKPRGYPGDAVLLDYIYRGSNDAACRGAGALIYRYTTNAPAARAVRHRRYLLARTIDEIAEEFERPRVLAIAAGHLRETDLSSAVGRGRLDRFVALDQDAESLATIRRDYSAFGIETVCASFKDLIAGTVAFKGFHLVYAAGLFDYLPQPVAQRLARTMARMLVPGGKILIANFLPDIEDVGYMESYMAWHLIFRTEADLLAVFDAIPAAEMSKVSVWRDPDQNIAFAAARKR